MITTDMPIKAIETRYAGCRFRSRLEARWAVFFDTLGVKWEYEPEGYEFDGERYLPDFAVDMWPGGRLLVEVKGVMTTSDSSKIVRFIQATQEPVLILSSLPDPNEFGPHHLLVGLYAFTRVLFVFDVAITSCPEGYRPLPFGLPDVELLKEAPDSGFLVGKDGGFRGYIPNEFAVSNAYAAARSARFEYGENGTVR